MGIYLGRERLIKQLIIQCRDTATRNNLKYTSTAVEDAEDGTSESVSLRLNQDATSSFKVSLFLVASKGDN